MTLNNDYSIPFYDRASDPTDGNPDVEPEINLLSSGSKGAESLLRLTLLSDSGAFLDPEVKYMIDDDQNVNESIDLLVN